MHCAQARFNTRPSVDSKQFGIRKRAECYAYCERSPGSSQLKIKVHIIIQSVVNYKLRFSPHL